jgi:hypothetical protein
MSAPPRTTAEERLRGVLRERALRSWGVARRPPFPPPNRTASSNPSKPRPPARPRSPQLPQPKMAGLTKRPVVGSPHRSAREGLRQTSTLPRSGRARRPATPSSPSRPTTPPRTDLRRNTLCSRRRGWVNNVPREGQSLAPRRSWPVRTGTKHEIGPRHERKRGPQMWCAGPADLREGDKKEIVAARACGHHTLPEGPPLYTTALCTLWNIHPYRTGVPCNCYVARERRV